jgi:hypothetical protein
MTASGIRKSVIVIGVSAIIVWVVCPRMWEAFERHRMKVTVTHMSQIGRTYLATQSRSSNCVEMLRASGVGLPAETCLDGWGFGIDVVISEGSDGSRHYRLAASGPGGNVHEPSFIWADGQWRLVMRGTPP